MVVIVVIYSTMILELITFSHSC